MHQTLATHWARVIELVYAAERAAELARDDEILSDKIRTIPTATPSEGVGCVEAPRGTLYHHYVTDERGILRKVNLIVGTTNNHARDCDVDPQGRSRRDSARSGDHGWGAQPDRDGFPRL